VSSSSGAGGSGSGGGGDKKPKPADYYSPANKKKRTDEKKKYIKNLSQDHPQAVKKEQRDKERRDRPQQIRRCSTTDSSRVRKGTFWTSNQFGRGRERADTATGGGKLGSRAHSSSSH